MAAVSTPRGTPLVDGYFLLILMGHIHFFRHNKGAALCNEILKVIEKDVV